MGVKERSFCRFWIGPTVYKIMPRQPGEPPLFSAGPPPAHASNVSPDEGISLIILAHTYIKNLIQVFKDLKWPITSR